MSFGMENDAIRGSRLKWNVYNLTQPHISLSRFKIGESIFKAWINAQ